MHPKTKSGNPKKKQDEFNMNLHHTNRALLVFILLLSSPLLYAATITAQLDVSPVIISDTFRLIYSAEGTVDDEPDFSPINKHFEILGTSQSNNISMINGEIKRTKKWILTLAAKNTGTFIIPAIRFGSDLAPEVEITVKPTPTSANNPSANFFVELEASKKMAYLQEQVIVTARLLIARNISSYQFSDLRIDDSDTIIKPLGKDRQYKTYRGSKQFVIIEKQFAIFPQHQGKLTIQPFVAEVAIPDSNSRGGFFIDPFNTYTTKKRIQSNKLDINVLDIPASFKAKHWLPSSSLKLIEDWPTNKTFTAGEPITRTLTIMADGLTSAQLPALDSLAIPGLKQYPDKPVLEDETNGKGISSIRKEKIAFIPTKPGSYTLPAIDLPWWNTKTQKIDIAHLSTRTFTVKPAATSAQPPIVQQPIPASPESGTASATYSTAQNDTQTSSIWQWVSILLFIAWLITFSLLIKTLRSYNKQSDKTDNSKQTLSKSLKLLKESCEKQDKQGTKSALLNWAKAVFTEQTPPKNLTELANSLEPEIADKIMALNTALYSLENRTWKCDGLYNLCRNYKPKVNTVTKKSNSAQLESFNAPRS